ncbi:hypothetical protein DITRI_Ditri01bG0128900 [Diplodiscus trichospermus]
MRRRVSSRFQNLPNVGNTSFETIYSGSDSKKPPNTRASPRLLTIPLEKRPYYGCSRKKKPSNASQDEVMVKKLKVDHSTSECVPDVYDLDNGGNTSFETISRASDSKKPPKTRASPRFQKIPLEKRPYYGCSQKKRPLNASHDKLMAKKLEVDHSMSECVPDVYDLDNGCNTSFEMISSQNDSKKPPKTRASPRFKKIPLEKRPYYGCSKKKRPLNASQDKLMVKKLEADHSMSECVPDVYDLDNGGNTSFETISSESDSKKPPKTRASPRFQKIPLEKRPYYGCSQKKRPLNASQDKLTVKKLKADHSVSDCVPDVYNLDNGGNTSFETISSESDSKKPPKTRASPRFQKIPLEKRPYYGCSQKKRPLNASQDKPMVKKLEVDRSMSECVPDVCDLDNGSNTRFETTTSESYSKKPPKTRASPRLQKVPLEKRPYYGCSWKKRPSNASQDKLMVKILNVYHSTLECVPDVYGLDNGCNTSFETIFGASDSKRPPKTRASPRLQKIPLEKRPYYGCSWETRPSNASQDKLMFKNLKVDHSTWEFVSDVYDLDNGSATVENSKKDAVAVEETSSKQDNYDDTLAAVPGRNMVMGVKNKLGLFNKYYLRFVKVNFVRGKLSRLHLESPGLVCKDISDGEEDKSIPVLNLYNPPLVPTGFKYIKSVLVAKNVSIPPDAPGCNCRGKCTNPKSCSCAQLNGGDFPYVSQHGGRLLEAKDIVFECGPNCGCGPQCVNRTSQRGLKYQLEVYCTKDKGWAVRSWDFIPSGAPVCEYVGVLRKNDELDNISENDYIFEIDCLHTMKGIGGRERRLGDVSLPASDLVIEVDEETLESDAEPEFCIDASSFGNVARFINHSCDPNLFVQCILSSHHDVRLARIVLFAADNIPPMQELTYDYNYAIDSVIGPDGKTKQLPCHCGTGDCRKRLY